MTKKIGIIGFGEMGKRHGLEFREATKGCIEICGVVEPDDMMYQRGCEWNEIPDIPHFETVGDLLKYAHPDGIIISWNHYRPHGAIRTGSLNFCMIPFEAGKLQFNGTPSLRSASKPFSAGLFR